MSKAKTHKATAKRIMVKRSKRNNKITLLKRTGGQDHFNARESGKVKRNKRRDSTMTPTVQHTILRAMPHA